MLIKIDQEICWWNNASDTEEIIKEVCKQSNWKLEDSGQWKHIEALEITELINKSLKTLGTFD